VRFFEKLRKLTHGKNRAEIARLSGLKPTVLNNYVYRGSEPMGGIALKLARVLKVPVDWLLDDEQGWPPPTGDEEQQSLTFLSGTQLMLELARRYRLNWIAFLDAFKAARTIDWGSACRAVDDADPAAPLPEVARQAILAMTQVSFHFEYAQGTDFRVDEFCEINHQGLPGAKIPLSDFKRAEDGFTLAEFENAPDVMAFYEKVKHRPEWWTRSKDPALQRVWNRRRQLESGRGEPRIDNRPT